MEKVKVVALVSAMHQKDDSIVDKIGITSNAVLVNQCDEDCVSERILENGCVVKMISSTQRGSSNSRNMALDNADGDIAIMCDDDEKLSQDYVDIITKAYSECPKASVIIFNMNRIVTDGSGRYLTSYRITKKRKAPFYKNYGSPQITFRIKDIKENGIKFNTYFGAGTLYKGGDDSLFIRDIRKKGLKVYENPETIADIYFADSTWFKGYNEEFYFNLGAFSYFAYGPLMRLASLILQITRKKHNDLKVRDKIKWFKIGKKCAKSLMSYKEYCSLVEKQKASKLP